MFSYNRRRGFYPQSIPKPQKIANWLGLEQKDHIKKKQCFDPSRSINNTYTWKKVKCNLAEIEYIENELGEYLYGFPSN